MISLQGCENASNTTDIYKVFVILSVVLFFAIGKGLDAAYGGKIRMKSGGGIVLILLGLSFVVFTTLSVISYLGDKKDVRLLKENPKVSSCLDHSQGKFSYNSRYYFTVKRPFIVIRWKQDGSGWKIIHYSEKKRLDENAVQNLKTVVVAKDADVPKHSQNYYYAGRGEVKATLKFYDAEIVYFDLLNNKYYENIINNNSPVPEKVEHGGNSCIDDEEIIKAVKSNENLYEVDNVLTEKTNKIGKTNKEEGKKFLAENAKRAGVSVTSSGLQYEIISVGTGAKPTLADKVKVHYRGTFINGMEFDSSYAHNMPLVFGLTQVIDGWREALQLMPVGSKWKIYVPHNLAYGSEGIGVIEPYSTLIYEVELLNIE